MTGFRLHSTGKSISRHTLRQFKFIIPGAFTTYIFDTHRVFLGLLNSTEPNDWGRTSATLSLAMGSFILGLFLYVLLVPWMQGSEPDYRSWRHSRILSSVIPMLTAAILSGWSLLSFTLGTWSTLGYLEGIIGASGLYALAFGLIGLLPAPKVHRS